jgi:hypothetical protein
MDEIFRDKSFIPDKELEVLHQTIRNDVINDFEVKFEEESDVKTVSEYKNSLEMQIMNEFHKIKNENKSKYEAYETLKLKVELEIKNFVREYEERMDKMLEFCGNETELINQHSIIGNDIKEEMLKYNPFNDFSLIDPYLTKLDVEAINLFKNERKFGEVEFMNEFELQQKIKNLKVEYRNKFHKTIKELETETKKQLYNALTYYNDVMYVLSDSVNSKSKFRESHEVIKAKSFNLFKQSCKVENNEFISEQISKLEREINKSFNELQERLSSRDVK